MAQLFFIPIIHFLFIYLLLYISKYHTYIENFFTTN